MWYFCKYKDALGIPKTEYTAIEYLILLLWMSYLQFYLQNSYTTT